MYNEPLPWSPNLDQFINQRLLKLLKKGETIKQISPLYGPLRDNLELTGTERNSVDETWEQPWGEVARVRDHHNELRVSVAETTEPGRRFHIVFRVFDYGLGFRCELPEQPGLQSFEIMEELTEFYIADNARAGAQRTSKKLKCGGFSIRGNLIFRLNYVKLIFALCIKY